MCVSLRCSGEEGLIARSHFAVLATVVSLSLAYTYIFTFQYAQPPFALDYKIFWEAAQQANPYINAGRRWFVNPPPALFVIGPLKHFEYWTGYGCVVFGSALAFVLAAARASNWQAAFLSLVSAAVLQGLLLGQIAILLGAAILLAVTLPALSMGLLLGAIASVKPQLLVMAPAILLIQREYRAFVGMVVGAVLMCLASLVFGPQLWIDWMGQLQPFYDAIHSGELWKQTISWGFYAHLLNVPVAPLIAIGLLIGIAGAGKAERADLAAILVGASLLVTPYALTHDLAAAIPAMSAALLSSLSRWSVPRGLLFVGALVPWSLTALTCRTSWSRLPPNLRSTLTSRSSTPHCSNTERQNP